MPDVSQVVTEAIPAGDEGTYSIVDRMRALVDSRFAHPDVRAVAVDLAARVPEHDITGQIREIRRFLAGRVRFIRDPDGPELLHDPVLVLAAIRERGVAFGDCDDVATLGATLGRSIGIPARFVVVGFFQRHAPFEHVWSELFDGRTWQELDTTRERPNDSRITRRAVIDAASGEITMLAPPTRAGQLGFLPAVPTVISFATKAGALWSAIAPFTKSKLDPERFKITDIAYQQAVNENNDVALLFLKQRTGDYGVINIPGIGDVGGWGSAKAREYARKQYAAAIAAGAKFGDDVSDIVENVQQAAASMPVGLLFAAGLAAFLLSRRGRR